MDSTAGKTSEFLWAWPTRSDTLDLDALYRAMDEVELLDHQLSERRWRFKRRKRVSV